MNRKKKCKQLEIEKARYELEIEFWLKNPSDDGEIYKKVFGLADVIVQLEYLNERKGLFRHSLRYREDFKKATKKKISELRRKYDIPKIFEGLSYKKEIEKQLQIKEQHEENLEQLLNEKPKSNPLNLIKYEREKDQIIEKIQDTVQKLAFTISIIDGYKLLSENKRTDFLYKVKSPNHDNEIRNLKKEIYEKYHINEALSRLYHPERYE